MTKEQAAMRIQELLAEVQSLADEHKIEFKFMGCSMRYFREEYDVRTDSYEMRAAPQGLLLSDEEWESSNCYGSKDAWLFGSY